MKLHACIFECQLFIKNYAYYINNNNNNAKNMYRTVLRTYAVRKLKFVKNCESEKTI